MLFRVIAKDHEPRHRTRLARLASRHAGVSKTCEGSASVGRHRSARGPSTLRHLQSSNARHRHGLRLLLDLLRRPSRPSLEGRSMSASDSTDGSSKVTIAFDLGFDRGCESAMQEGFVLIGIDGSSTYSAGNPSSWIVAWVDAQLRLATTKELRWSVMETARGCVLAWLRAEEGREPLSPAKARRAATCEDAMRESTKTIANWRGWFEHWVEVFSDQETTDEASSHDRRVLRRGRRPDAPLSSEAERETSPTPEEASRRQPEQSSFPHWWTHSGGT